jgi:hypothetical protein
MITIYFLVIHVNIKELTGANALLDQGSLAGDFISSQILFDFDRKKQNKCNIQPPGCSGLDSVCMNISAKSIILNVSFCKESQSF